jgi:hypothetical protein
MTRRLKSCSCCNSRAIYVKWCVGVYTLWAVECEMRCFLTDFFYSKGEARDQWEDKDVQKSLTARGKWERRNR